MPDVPFCPTGWNFLDYPPYTGQWWALTRHGTVEMVDVTLKRPKHLGKPENPTDPLRTVSADPYTYQFGDGCTTNVEVLASRRWTHWMPVVPPEPPLDRDPVASGLADPTPGPRVASFRRDAGHAEAAGPSTTVEHELERRAARREAAAHSAFQASVRERFQAEYDRLDREDASAYVPIDLPPGSDADKPVTPCDLLDRVQALAAYVASLGGVARQKQYERLRAVNPALYVLLRAAVNELRERADGDRAA